VRHVAVVLLAIAAACGTAPPRVTQALLAPDASINVLPFAPAAGASTPLGSDFAARVVEELRRRGRSAELANEAIPGIATVSGRLLSVDGGSRAKRFWIGMGAGRASVSAEGTITRPDGTTLATFRERRSSSGEAELGFAGDEYLVAKCMRALAEDVADMVVSGSYRQIDLD
jgi:uncharacterized protein DUF4410/lipopolysaccharide assembly LptE-like protein